MFKHKVSFSPFCSWNNIWKSAINLFVLPRMNKYIHILIWVTILLWHVFWNKLTKPDSSWNRSETVGFCDTFLVLSPNEYIKIQSFGGGRTACGRNACGRTACGSSRRSLRSGWWCDCRNSVRILKHDVF